jgi:hypothetical protein
MLAVDQDVSHPQFNLFFFEIFFVNLYLYFLILFGIYDSKITEKDSLLEIPTL